MDDADEAYLLCLACRLGGHTVMTCPLRRDARYPGHAWSFTCERASLLRSVSAVGDKLCQRCEDLNILSMFSEKLAGAAFATFAQPSLHNNQQQHRDLGNVETIRFDKRCGLCVAIFNITPSPSSHQANVHLFAEWTIHRLEQLINVKSHPDQYFDICIIAEVRRYHDGAERGEHLGDALAVQRPSSLGRSCSALAIEPDHFDLRGLQALMEKCERGHELTCVSKQSTSQADMTLIDVATRQISSYPGRECKYLALSYVWGAVVPPKPNKDKKLPRMPATIEDAIRLTLMLDIRYLWVDAVCMNQENADEKAHQISIMADIYRGAYATIVALSGTSSEHGLTRLRHDNDSQPQPQLFCSVGEISLVGLMPTLSSQIAHQKWGRRAWTLQEALLSQRSIFFTDHQVYFECNAIQCCETIDTSRSWIHNAPRSVATYTNNPGGQRYGHGTLRNAAVLPGRSHGCLEAYGTLLSLYSGREMTLEEDALNAFSAILMHLKELGFEHGFCQGLPEDDLNWSLLWCGWWSLTRREGFPAWSWAGWRGNIRPGWPSKLIGPNTQPYWTHFYAWTYDGSMRSVFPHHEPSEFEEPLFPAGKTAFDLREPPQIDRMLEERCIAAGASVRYLLLDCLVLRDHFTLGDACPSWDYDAWKHYSVILNNVPCHIRLAQAADKDRVTSPQNLANYILTGRDKTHQSGTMRVVHHFLDVDIIKDGKSLRKGVMKLIIPESSPHALHGLRVTRRGIILT